MEEIKITGTRPQAKVIGFHYIQSDKGLCAVDVYEGNYLRYPHGEVLSLDQKTYDKVYADYLKCVEEGREIPTAYETNKRLNLSFKIPETSADPEAARKEMFLRQNPQVIELEQPEKKEKKGLFGRKKKAKMEPPVIGIRCPICGEANPLTSKFCSSCGHKLPTIEEAKEENKVWEGGEEPKEEPKESTQEPVAPVETRYDNEKEPMQAVPEKPVYEVPKEKRSRKIERHRRATFSEDEFPEDEFPEDELLEEELLKGGPKKKKDFLVVFIIIVILVLALCGSVVFAFLTLSGDSSVTTIGSNPSTQQEQKAPQESYVVIQLKEDVSANEEITEDMIEGIIMSADQYAKYNNVSTYFDGHGEEVTQKLVLWENRSEIIGKFAAMDMTVGSLMYDVSVISQKVVADKTYVDAEVNGEDVTYEVEENVLPGNTRIQIVAIVSTDGQEPKTVLLSEMQLKDRSLESIFNSAGQDILSQLAGENESEESSSEEMANEEENVSEESSEESEEE